MQRCTLHISWTPPNNIAISDVSHFMLYVEGVNVDIKANTDNDTLLSIYYDVCSCDHHNISIRAVNRCGYEGNLSTYVIQPPKISGLYSICDSNNTLITNCSCDTTADKRIQNNGKISAINT